MTHSLSTPYAKPRHFAARGALILLGAWLLALSAPLAAQGGPGGIPQPQASDSKESFLLEPAGLATGAKNAYLRLISNTPAGFASSSSRAPELKVGSGAELVPGSFRLLNANEAECRVNVDADAAGICEVSVILYSVNGTKALSTLRASLGLLGPVKVGNVDVSVESTPVVRVNVTEAQSAGVIVLSGNLGGAVQMTAPTGTRFQRAPQPVTNKGTISAAALAENNTQFSFVINSGQADTVVRITDIVYDTSLFTTTGGTAGALNVALGGAALGGQSTLVANAHTALTTVAGSNDNTDAPPKSSQGSGSSSDGTSTSGTSVNNPPSSSGTTRTRETDRTDRQSRRNQGDSRSSTSPAGGGQSQGNPPVSSNPPPPAPGPAVQPAPGGRPEAPPGPAMPKPSGPGTSSAGDGSATFSKGQPGEAKEPAAVEQPKPVLITTPGLYICDKDFKPLDLVVLNALVADKAGARVWIVVKLKADKTPEVDTIDVTLRVCGVSRTLKLTETGKTTGEFRCDKAGVLLVSNEDPDSSAGERPAAEPKPRPSGWSK